MKYLFLCLIAMTSGVYAADRNDADEAICQPMTFESDRADCMDKIRFYNYFDDRALKFCETRTFTSERVDCLRIIGNRWYGNVEMDHCLHQTFESKKLECLQTSGYSHGHVH